VAKAVTDEENELATEHKESKDAIELSYQKKLGSSAKRARSPRTTGATGTPSTT
jgi:hypothetical protein